ncbi:hypothetical protein CHS0354_006845 [Potamilus streckersoni]|uniref:Uncharacterized protein n=1 Tax=Potamilus streckersoni TaxID=2493646 RepID=A0AAE0WC54_9BIVA|nr:hypothetical protein CHS0354_006845 [Potamilus streckersoni]
MIKNSSVFVGGSLSHLPPATVNYAGWEARPVNSFLMANGGTAYHYRLINSATGETLMMVVFEGVSNADEIHHPIHRFQDGLNIRVAMEVIRSQKPVIAEQSVSDRLSFIRKVYHMLILSVLVAVGTCYLAVTNEAVVQFIASNFILTLVMYIGLLVFVFFARKKPSLGIIALFSFTAFTGVMAAIPVIMYSEHVFNAAVLSLLAFGGLSFYVLTTRKDFSFMGGFLTVGVILLIVGSLLNVFWLQSSGFDFMITIAGILIFCGFILYDTSNIIHRYAEDEVIMATLALYLDLLNLFLYILRFLGASRD